MYLKRQQKMAEYSEPVIKSHLDICLRILNQYSWLLDSYILDFFVEHHFEKLQKCWIQHLRSISVEELARFLDFENYELNSVWPLSLTVLHFLVRHLCLTRKPNPSKSDIPKGDKINISHVSCFVNNTKNCSDNNNVLFKYSLLTNPKLKNLFVKHVKPKKRYEIVKMAEVTAEVAGMLGVDYLVDIGSGLGHLSRICGYGFGLNVLSVESDDSFSYEAEKLDKELEVTASKHLSEAEMNYVRKKRPIHIPKTITSDITSEEFLQLITQSFEVNHKPLKFGIVGLHACGNLALKLLKIFIECDAAKFINIVGCCYHKITVASENTVENGFPISHYCQTKCASLSYEARALACHALEFYCRRLDMNDYHHLKIHNYRAVLEYIISKKWPNLRRSPLGNVKHGPDLTFKLYCERALKKMHITVNDEDLTSEETLQHLSEWKDVVLYYSLRLLLAPLVETVVLMDRMFYVIENGYRCNVRALFEPLISPRNFVLMAEKNLA